MRSPAWLKLKQRLTLAVRIEHFERELVRWGDRGWTSPVTLTYQHPRTGEIVTIDEIVRVPQPDGFAIGKDATVELICWGVMPRGGCGIRCSCDGARALRQLANPSGLED